jgi:hypothetical protein
MSLNNILLDNSLECQYVANKKKNRDNSLPKELKELEYKTIHWGQRKLLLSEIEFFLISMEKGKIYNVLYPGSAQGDHIPLLYKYFKPIFHLYDPSRFCDELTRREDIYKINEYGDSKLPNGFFTDEIATKYCGMTNLLFISDIRLPPENIKKNDVGYSEKFQNNVSDDMTRQKKWVEIINPIACLLKLCFQYDSTTTLNYFEGNIHHQAWAPSTSTEKRLLVTEYKRKKDYLPLKYERQCAYFNVYQRMTDISKIDINFNGEINIDGKFRDIWSRYNILIGADCYIETLIIYKLLIYLNEKPTIENIVKYIDEFSQHIYPKINPRSAFEYKIKLNRIKKGRE